MRKEVAALVVIAGVNILVACGENSKATKTEVPAPDATTATLGVPPQVAEDRWEYVTFAPPDIVYDETLNRLGTEGWELVNARRVKASSFGEMAYEITLRRRSRANRPSTTAEEQSIISLRAALEKRKRAFETSTFATGSDTLTTSSVAEQSRQPVFRVVGYKEHSEPVYEQVAVDTERREYHLLQCPSAARFPLLVGFASIKAQRIPRAVDCANVEHRVISMRTWREPIREPVTKP